MFERTAHLDCSDPSGSQSSGPGSSSAVDCTSARVEAGSQYVGVLRACAGAVQDSEYAPLNVEVSRQPVKAGPPEGGG